jgi:hypothetical protein
MTGPISCKPPAVTGNTQPTDTRSRPVCEQLRTATAGAALSVEAAPAMSACTALGARRTALFCSKTLFPA